MREKEEPFGIEEVALDEQRADEVLVRIAGAGVCRTDLICRDQRPLPAVFGHEGGLDEVNEAGEDSESGEVLKPVLRIG